MENFMIPDSFKRYRSLIKQQIHALTRLNISDFERNVYIGNKTIDVYDYVEDNTKYVYHLYDCDPIKIDQYEITPIMLVKNYQSLFRDSSIARFMNDKNRAKIEAFISENRYYTVVYNVKISMKNEKLDLKKEVVPFDNGPFLEEKTEIVEKERVVENDPIEPILEQKKEIACIVEERPIIRDERKPIVFTKPSFRYQNLIKEVVTEKTPNIRNEVMKPSYLSIVKQQMHINDLPIDESKKTETSSENSLSTITSSNSYSSSRHSQESYVSQKQNRDKSTTEYDYVTDYYNRNGRDVFYIIFQRNNKKFHDTTQYLKYEEDDKNAIKRMLNDLFKKNEKVKKMIRENNYYYCKVIKSFHKDMNMMDKSLHFNIIFKTRYTESEVFHVYTDTEKTKVVTFTRTENLL
jgi:hypothetical protein